MGGCLTTLSPPREQSEHKMGRHPKNVVRRDPRSGRMPYDEAPPARSALNAVHKKCRKEGPTWKNYNQMVFHLHQ